MTGGQAGDADFYQSLNSRITGIVAHSKLIAQFPDPYYGGLKVYELQAP